MDSTSNVNLWSSTQHALDYLKQADSIPHRTEGEAVLLDCVPAWDGNWTWDCFLAFAWQGPGGDRLLVAVNYAGHHSQCYVRLPFTDLVDGQWHVARQL